MDHLKVFTELVIIEGLPCGSVVRICLPMQETQVRSLSQDDALEKEMATHSSILAWEISWPEEPVELQSMELHMVKNCAI